MHRLKGGLPAIRVVASVVMLGVLIQRVHLASILPDGSHAAQWLAAAIVVWFVGVILSALRWQRVLVALEPCRRDVVRHYSPACRSNSSRRPRAGRLRAPVGAISGEESDFASVVLERSRWFVRPYSRLTPLFDHPGLARRDGPASRVIVACHAGDACGISPPPSVDRGRLRARVWRRFAGRSPRLEHFRRNLRWPSRCYYASPQLTGCSPRSSSPPLGSLVVDRDPRLHAGGPREGFPITIGGLAARGARAVRSCTSA